MIHDGNLVAVHNSVQAVRDHNDLSRVSNSIMGDENSVLGHVKKEILTEHEEKTV